MASIRKFKASRFWFAVYRDATGQQCNRSTKISIAGEGATERERGRDAADKQRIAREIAQEYERAERGHPSELHITKVLHAIFQKVNKRRMTPAIVDTFCTAWLGKVRTRRGQGGTLARYKTVIDRFLDSLGTRRSVALSDVTAADIQSYVDAQAAAGKAASTVRIEHKVLTSVFSDALKQGLVANNPAAAVAVPMDAGETRAPFDWPQIRALLAAAEGEWKTLILLGAFTGARLGDCCSMRWENLDLPARLVRYRPSKTKAKGGELIVPMHPDLEAHLLTIPMPDGADAAKQPICPGLAAIGIGGRAGLSRKFQEIIGAANIENQQTRKGQGRGRSLSAYSFHSLRHAFNSALMNRGVGEDIRMRLSGHASEEMNRRYSHAEVETLRDAVAKLPGVTS
jgi:integrase